MATTKERILEASTELFRRQGFTGTGVKQILDQEHAQLGSLYHHFPGGKDELAAETLRRAGAHYAMVVADAIGTEPDLAAGVRAAFVLAAETLERTDYADACPIETVALEVASTNEPLRAAAAEVFESWLGGLAARLVAEGVTAERARALAHTIIAALEGAFVLARTARRTDALVACGDDMAALVDAAIGTSRRRRR